MGFFKQDILKDIRMSIHTYTMKDTETKLFIITTIPFFKLILRVDYNYRIVRVTLQNAQSLLVQVNTLFGN